MLCEKEEEEGKFKKNTNAKSELFKESIKFHLKFSNVIFF